MVRLDIATREAFLHGFDLTYAPLAMEYDPDRFIDDRLRKYLTPNPFIFLPFNAGPRICLGQKVGIFRFLHLTHFDPLTSDSSQLVRI